MPKGLLNIVGPEVRTVLAAISTHLGIVYAIFGAIEIFGIIDISDLYRYHQSLLPLWVFSLLFLLLGISTFYTVEERLSHKGRCIAAFGMSIYLLYSLTFILNTALTALAVYLLLSLIYFLEAFAQE